MNLFKTEVNKEAQTTLVFLHGNSSSSRLFSDFFDSSNLDANLVAYDLPGHGLSKKCKDFNFIDFTSKVITEINSLDNDIVLVGHSLGGHLALQVSEQINDLKGLILMGTPPLKRPLNLEEAFLPLSEMNVYFVRDSTDVDLRNAIRALVYDNTDTFFLEDDYRYTDSLFREIVANEWLSNDRYADEKNIFQSLSIPKFIIHGTRDPLVNYDYLKESLGTNLSGSMALYEVKDCGHFVSLEKPLEFEKILSKIFDKIKF
jgi:pimeloyl-ACP methyl ester carboxylesterase